MKIAILDPRLHATGLKLLFPESDYYVTPHNNQYNLDKTPDYFYNTYGCYYREDIDSITPENYDILFIIYAIYDFKDKSRDDVQYHLGKIMNVMNQGIKQVFFFDNHDYFYDPSLECPYLRPDIWFKRNYSTTLVYNQLVKPFPFIIFGYICPLWKVLQWNYNSSEKIDRVLWGGAKTGNNPNRNQNYLTREIMIHSIENYLTNIYVSNQTYMEELSKSKFSLDLNGDGDPNIRTFEVLCSNSLLLQQHKEFVWPFENGDSFSEETIFKTPEEFFLKLKHLRENESLYIKSA